MESKINTFCIGIIAGTLCTFVYMEQQQFDKWINQRKKTISHRTADGLFEGIRAGNIADLSAAITLVESTLESDKQQAQALIQRCLPHVGNAIRIGITGVPGVGKSTFIESVGKILVEQGKHVAVLAIDPSSATSGGSILGDKTRMNELAVTKEVYIRPSAAGSTLGGVARKTRETIFLCEAAGFDVILVETVGVGQSETLVHSMVDFFLLLMLSGAGDELQGIKRGIMELADALVITKADGDNLKRAKLAASEYAAAMHLFPPKSSQWIAPAKTCSSIDKIGLVEVLDVIDSFVNTTKLNGWFDAHRKRQDNYWFMEGVKEKLMADLFEAPSMKVRIQQLQAALLAGEISAFQAADQLFNAYKKGNGTGI